MCSHEFNSISTLMHAHTLSDICDAEPPVSQLMTFSARVTHTHTHKITLILTFYFTL